MIQIILTGAKYVSAFIMAIVIAGDIIYTPCLDYVRYSLLYYCIGAAIAGGLLWEGIRSTIDQARRARKIELKKKYRAEQHKIVKTILGDTEFEPRIIEGRFE